MTDKQKIDLANCPSNSYKDRKEKEEKKNRRVDPVIKKDKIVSTKKSTSRRILETFLDDDIEDIRSYFLFNKLIPGLKNGFWELLETMFFGNGDDRRRYGMNGRNYSSYSSYYRSGGEWRYDRERNSRRDREEYYPKDDKIDYRNIVVQGRADANDVINKMIERIEEYGACSVADLFDMIDLPSNYVDNNWGWVDERDIRVRRVSAGFLIDVPEAVYLG